MKHIPPLISILLITYSYIEVTVSCQNIIEICLVNREVHLDDLLFFYATRNTVSYKRVAFDI